MSQKSLLPRSVAKNGFKGVKIITFIGVASLMLTQVIVASELKTITKVPTTYNVSELSYLVNRQIPAGYVKANYEAIYSPNTQSKTPSSKDLSLQEAAEIAAQEIFKYSDEKLDNQTLQMSYFHYPQASRPYSTWQASVGITPSYLLSVEIDGSTGELIRIKSTGGPNIDNEFDIDAPSTTKLINELLDPGNKQFTLDLDDSYAKVQNLITKTGYIAEPIKSITYQYISADAFAVVAHTFDVTTASNKLHRFSLSQDLTQLRDYQVLGTVNE
ncbi:hypothetical protein [Paenibacillus macquariensis]|uniref:Uncharacterized protein n=1 Tax=Paenibacillus macquariensis TaxID=948756 RepID=A0ABY1KF05_9BACL|nr:hypothetical protein [Paenibacillus macquariensis]MEC0093161.1 hypothetical protein [Paenibacillus macquariensis]OAB34307.1 hypothetical protein PMSM_13265 [Paenibacillus macquariensis subsp. macquariensis]SIR73475.1 hypothetical protein SAMN05421578_1526 [Paenibacillus macquariensis]